MNQPGKVANLIRGQLNRENIMDIVIAAPIAKKSKPFLISVTKTNDTGIF